MSAYAMARGTQDQYTLHRVGEGGSYEAYQKFWRSKFFNGYMTNLSSRDGCIAGNNKKHLEIYQALIGRVIASM